MSGRTIIDRLISNPFGNAKNKLRMCVRDFQLTSHLSKYNIAMKKMSLYQKLDICQRISAADILIRRRINTQKIICITLLLIVGTLSANQVFQFGFVHNSIQYCDRSVSLGYLNHAIFVNLYGTRVGNCQLLKQNWYMLNIFSLNRGVIILYVIPKTGL